MADGSVRTPGTGENVATFDVGTYQGVTNAKVQAFHGVYVTGSPGSHTLREIHGAATPAATDYGLNVREVPQVVSVARFVTAASTNATSIKASAGRLKSIYVYNNAAYPVYAKNHNTAGTPTAGSGVVFSIGCQAGMAVHYRFGNGGMTFATGIGGTVVKDIADAGTTAVAASDAIVVWEYE